MSSDTRSNIISAALDLLLSGHGRNVRMSDVAKRAGVSRQAVYLHFENRADLLIAATHQLDQKLGTEVRLAPSRDAKTGRERLSAFIRAWGNYIPEIHGLARAMMAMSETDKDAALAWRTRMNDLREGCAAAIAALDHDGNLTPDLTPERATDILWTMLQVPNWEHYRFACGWSQNDYIDSMVRQAERQFVRRG